MTAKKFEILFLSMYNSFMDDIKYTLADFIDEFNRSDPGKKQKMVEKFPFTGITDIKYTAYIAAMVEELCFQNKMDIPEWVWNKQFQLKEPFFVGGLESLKAFLIAESPLPFRRRNIFVSSNVLQRV
jgi:hypothetical protein